MSGLRRLARLSFRGLLVLMMVPLLVITSGTNPAAATGLYGPSVNLAYEWDDWRPGTHGSCSLPGFHEVRDTGGLYIHIKQGRCKVGWGTNMTDMRIVATGQDTSMQECSAEFNIKFPDHYFAGHDEYVNGEARASSESCHIKTACVQIRDPEFIGEDWTAERCSAWDLGSPERALPGVCPDGDVPQPPIVGDDYYDGNSRFAMGRFRNVETIIETPAEGGRERTWWTYVVMSRTKGGQGVTYQNGEPVVVFPHGFPFWGAGQQNTSWMRRENTGRLTASMNVKTVVKVGLSSELVNMAADPNVRPDEAAKIVGVGVYGQPSWTSTTGMDKILNDTSETDGWHVNGRIGRTDPANCSWYWGAKIALTNNPNDTRDEPIGGLEVPDHTPEEPTVDAGDPGGGCGNFSLKDPSSWLGPAICELVKAIGKIADLVWKVLKFLGGLVADLLGGLRDLFLELFIPDADVIEGEIDDVQDSWESGRVGSWLDELDGLGLGGVQPQRAVPPGSGSLARDLPDAGGPGSCLGPAVRLPSMFDDLEVTEFGGGTFHPFSSCKEPMASYASYVRTFLMAVIGVGGALKLLSMLLVSLGAIKQTDILLRHDWSGPASGRLNH